MSLLGLLLDIFMGGEKKVDLGRLPQGDLEAILRLETEMDQARRKDPAKLQQLLLEYAMRDFEHFEEASTAVKMAIRANDPNYAQNVAAILNRVQIEEAQAKHGVMLGDASREVIGGLSLQQLAQIHAALQKIDARNPQAVAQTLAGFGVPAQRYQEADQAWRQRMDYRRDPMGAGSIMPLYMTFLAQYGGQFDRAAYGL